MWKNKLPHLAFILNGFTWENKIKLDSYKMKNAGVDISFSNLKMKNCHRGSPHETTVS